MSGRAFAAALSCCLAVTGALPASAPAQGASEVVIRGGWLWNCTGDERVPNPGIYIRAGKILQLGGDSAGLGFEDPRILEVGDAETILPGFFDLHAHYAVDLFGRGRVDERVAYPLLFLANGVTSTFPAGEVNPEEMRE
ncbi:MAG: hypothetical protein ACR2F9_05125, partial [Longimicrobiaceae bacterium]